MYTLKDTTTTHEWDSFVQELEWSPMTQSSLYGDFYRSTGEEARILGVYDDFSLVGGAIVFTVHARRGSHLYIPYGPVAKSGVDYGEVLSAVLSYTKNWAKKEKFSFVRISPFVDDTESTRTIFKKLRLQKAPMHALAETTCLLNVMSDEQELLLAMNKNHRNLIRRCEKEGVAIEIHSSHEELKKFHELHDVTADRHKFIRFSNDYVEQEFTAFEKEQGSLVIYAYLPDGTLDSAAVVYYWGTMACYRHGASLGKNHKIPTPYLVQWTAIKEAKKRGMRWYNFWGIAPEGAHKNHPFKGITHFKKGFGGEVKQLAHCADFVVNPFRYTVVRAIETVRKFKRGF